MILIGLAGWGDHDDLYPDGTPAGDKLKVYSRHFPVVEVDSSFYAVQPERNIAKWLRDTPGHFSFVFKAYQGMTGHARGKLPYATADEMFDSFHLSIGPVHRAGRLKAVLFQYPPWFDCCKKHVELLKRTRERMGDVPVALEFRHQSWFRPAYIEKTLAFMEREGWIHSICDEPQAGEGSVPTVERVTSHTRTIVRFHGRNAEGWNRQGKRDEWRAVRYLYRYSEAELEEWKARLIRLEKQCEEICVLFNNNSGGDAASNAKQLQQMLGQEPEPLPPSQIELDS
ncbi:DUF72 domain-containing protein [Xylanibacillus composti]|uniref:UPF0759 protein YunF n=1 Tax=Xylanibacillus composti TaxID=1572762 RepID=A0A8J4M306_9BACL|nr:DUF72 domain-containing protein [Xylanibacillus composti]MDT9725319.1 DUF72 domain-containing protein [Xylanibacillus composti]GIQ69081.1 UPF0759 protein YunF [Xylanibacillus composti]